jgi:hypothetical protein
MLYLVDAVPLLKGFCKLQFAIQAEDIVDACRIAKEELNPICDSNPVTEVFDLTIRESFNTEEE